MYDELGCWWQNKKKWNQRWWSSYITCASFTHRHVYTETITHRNFYTQKHVYTEELLHTDFFTQRSLCTGMFTYKNFTQRIAYMFIHSDAFTHRCFYTQKLLQRGVFTHRRVYTEEFLHTDACTHRTLKVLRPYFLSPFRKWHKKGSSPRNHSNAEGL
jgi:hypothetical protein